MKCSNGKKESVTRNRSASKSAPGGAKSEPLGQQSSGPAEAVPSVVSVSSEEVSVDPRAATDGSEVAPGDADLEEEEEDYTLLGIPMNEPMGDTVGPQRPRRVRSTVGSTPGSWTGDLPSNLERTAGMETINLAGNHFSRPGSPVDGTATQNSATDPGASNGTVSPPVEQDIIRVTEIPAEVAEVSVDTTKVLAEMTKVLAEMAKVPAEMTEVPVETAAPAESETSPAAVVDARENSEDSYRTGSQDCEDCRPQEDQPASRTSADNASPPTSVDGEETGSSDVDGEDGPTN